MISIKTEEEIKIMAEGGKILAFVLKEVAKNAKPGVRTLELDRAAEALILSMGAKPAFKNFEGFPYSLCVSVNDVIVHGLPSPYVLKEGDLVKLDLGVFYKGYNTDMAISVPVGKPSFEVKKIIDVTKKSLHLGIKKVKIGNTTGDIGSAVQRFVEKSGFGIVRDLCGHGIGKQLHEEPRIPNFGSPKNGIKLKEGMVICIEPMVTAGDWRIQKAIDGYGYSTKDESMSAHFELTIAVTKRGPRILTQ